MRLDTSAAPERNRTADLLRTVEIQRPRNLGIIATARASLAARHNACEQAHGDHERGRHGVMAAKRKSIETWPDAPDPALALALEERRWYEGTRDRARHWHRASEVAGPGQGRPAKRRTPGSKESWTGRFSCSEWEPPNGIEPLTFSLPWRRSAD